MKNFFLDLHGCAKNQVDAELLLSRLENLGWQRVVDPSLATLIVINTCGFIESAKKESIEALMDARVAYPDAKIVLAGCLAERYAGIFKDSLFEADAILGNGDLKKIDDIVFSLENGERPVMCEPQKGVCAGERSTLLNFPGSTYIKITEGCNNCCAFCAIPLIRGELRSRSEDEIVEEIRILYERGVFEFNLIGQDLAAYGRDGVTVGNSADSQYFETPSPLLGLLKKISQIEGDFWVRLLYIHPDHFPFDILEVLKKDSRFLPYFDIPFQCGDDYVLKRMNRTLSADGYKRLAEKIRSECQKTMYKDSSLRTTFLCGFPGETDESALKTESFLQSVAVDWSGCFTYSPEEDTVGYTLDKRVEEDVSKKRACRLESLQEKITQTRLQRHIGKKYRVLIEEIIEAAAFTEEGDSIDPELSPESIEGLAVGRAWFQAPDVDGACVVRYDCESEEQRNAIIPGKTIFVKVLGVSGVDLDTVLLCGDS